jgi:hypothetical protein
MDSTKEINNNTKEFDDCIIVPNDDNDVPVTKEEDEVVYELLNGKDFEEKQKLRNDYLECRKFYTDLKGLNQYDLTENNFKYWKGKPYVGTSYREFIKKSSKIMVCTCLVNERVQINVFDRLFHQKKKGNVPINKGILKYVQGNSSFNHYIYKEQSYYLKKSADFLEWRFKSHLYRFGFIKKYLEEEYNLNYNDFKNYKDVEDYFNLVI